MPAQTGYFDAIQASGGSKLTVDETTPISEKLTIPGAWTTPAFVAENFTATASMT